MNKKEYILKILEVLEEKRPIAKGLKILVQGNALDEESIESLIAIFNSMIEETQDKETKEKFQKSKNILEKLQKIERDQHIKDQKELDNLDAMIKDL